MKKFVLLLTMIAVAGVLSASGQRCGGSTRRMEIIGSNGPLKYELFYVAPKNGQNASIDDPTIGKFLNEFLDDYGLSGNFWIRKIVDVKPETAEQYVKLYRESDFAYIYDDVWHKHHAAQLRGETADGKIAFRTSEMDNIPFLMMLTGGDIETQFVLSAFLGGCWQRDELQTIEVKGKKK